MKKKKIEKKEKTLRKKIFLEKKEKDTKKEKIRNCWNDYLPDYLL